MSLSIRSNTTLGLQRRLNQASDDISRSFGTLSSGARINRAADDPAGLAISTSLRVQSRIFARAVENINDGIGLLNVTEGALAELKLITTRQQELAQQGANGLFSPKQRDALQREASALSEEFARIVTSTKYNGLLLLNAEGELSLQAGSGQESRLAIANGSNLTVNKGDGTFTASTSYSVSRASAPNAQESLTAADFNRDGNVDLASVSNTSQSLKMIFGNGDGTFQTPKTISLGVSLHNITSREVTGDGVVDLIVAGFNSQISILQGNGDGTFSVKQNIPTGAGGVFSVDLQDVDGDSIPDLVSGELIAGLNKMLVRLGNGDGTFRTSASFSTGSLVKSLAFGDFNGDKIFDAVVAEEGSDRASLLLGNGDGTFRQAQTLGSMDAASVQVVDLNRDGRDDIIVADEFNSRLQVFLGNGNSTFQRRTYATPGAPSSLLLADLNDDGLMDIATGATTADYLQVLLGNGDGSFKATTTFDSTSSRYIALADFNKDGVHDLAAYSSNTPDVNISLGRGIKRAAVPVVDMTSQSTARSSLSVINAFSERIEAEQGRLGAFQARLAAAVKNLHTMRENYLAADARIMDADLAMVTAEVVRKQIIEQSGVAVYGQAQINQRRIIELLVS